MTIDTLRYMYQQGSRDRILPVFRKTGTRLLGADAFERARDIEVFMRALPYLLDVAEAAETVDRIYEGLRTDANDGEFALWSEDDLVAALHKLRPALHLLERQ